MREEIIGNCRLILGDCRDILPTLGVVDSVVSDPPYGMAFQSNYRTTQHDKIANDDTTDLFLWACSIPVSHSRYLFGRWDNIADVPKPKSLITWVKNNWSMGDLEHEHGRQTEVCFFYAGEGHFWPGKRPNDVIECPRTGNDFHPTEKPVALMEVVVGWTAGLVFDPFMGAGSTGIAACVKGRPFVGCEIHEPYFDIACRRIEEAHRQPRLFAEPSAKPVQEALAF